MTIVQYDIFKSKEECEMDSLRLEMAATRISCDKVRRKLFAENGSLKKIVVELSDRLTYIERGICKPIGVNS